jgi:hypothetical protein
MTGYEATLISCKSGQNTMLFEVDTKKLCFFSIKTPIFQPTQLHAECGAGVLDIIS